MNSKSKGNNADSYRDTSSSTNYDSQFSGFNAKSPKAKSKYDERGERKMRLNYRPIFFNSGMKTKSVKGKKASGISLRNKITRGSKEDDCNSDELSRNLIDDQSISSLELKDEVSFPQHSSFFNSLTSSTPNISEVSFNQSEHNNGEKHEAIRATSSHSLPNIKSPSSGRKGFQSKERKEKFHNLEEHVVSEALNEQVNNFDGFVFPCFQGHDSGDGELYQSKFYVSRLDTPSIQRANHIEEGQANDDDASMTQDVYMTKQLKKHETKKSKMQKISELLADKKKWSIEKKALRSEILKQSEQISDLQARLKELGFLPNENRSLRDMDDEDVTCGKTGIMNSPRIGLVGKKLLTKKKKLEFDSDSPSPEYFERITDDPESMDLQEGYERPMKQKEFWETSFIEDTDGMENRPNNYDEDSFDRESFQHKRSSDNSSNAENELIVSLRSENKVQVEKYNRLKGKLEKNMKLIHDSEDMKDKIFQLTSLNEDIFAQLEEKEKALFEIQKSHDAIVKSQESLLDQSEAHRFQLMNDLESLKSKVKESQSEAMGQSHLPTCRAFLSDLEENHHGMKRVKAAVLDSALLPAGTDHDCLKLPLSKLDLKDKHTIGSFEVNQNEWREKVCLELETKFKDSGSIGLGPVIDLKSNNVTLNSSLESIKMLYRDTKEEFQSQIKKKNMELEEMTKDLELCKERHIESEKARSDLSAEVLTLRNSIEELRKRHANSESQAREEIENLTTKLYDVEAEELKMSKLQNKASMSISEELRSTNAELEIMFQHNEREEGKENGDLRSKVVSLTAVIDESQVLLDDTKRQCKIEIEKKSAELDLVVQELESIKTRESHCVKRNHELNDQIFFLQSSLEESRKLCQVAEKELIEAKSKLHDVEANWKENKVQTNVLEKSVANLTLAITDLQVKLKEDKATSLNTESDLKSQVFKLSSSLRDLQIRYQMEKDESERKIERKEDELGKALFELERYKIRDTESEKIICDLTIKLSALQTSVDESKRLSLFSGSQAESELVEAKEQIHALETDLKEANVQNKLLESMAEELRATNADFEDEISGLLKEQIELRKKTRKLISELKEVRERANSEKELEDRLVEVEELSLDLKRKNEQLQQELAQMSKEKETLQDQVEILQKHPSDTNEAISALEDLLEEYEDLQSETVKLSTTVTRLEREIEKVKADYREQKSFADRTLKELEEAKKESMLTQENLRNFENLRKENSELHRRVMELQNQVEDIQLEKAGLIKSLDLKEIDHGKASARLEVLENEIQVKDLESKELCSRLESYRSKLEEESARFATERNTLMEQIHNSNSTLQAKKSTISCLQQEIEMLKCSIANLSSKMDVMIIEKDCLKATLSEKEKQSVLKQTLLKENILKLEDGTMSQDVENKERVFLAALLPDARYETTMKESDFEKLEGVEKWNIEKAILLNRIRILEQIKDEYSCKEKATFGDLEVIYAESSRDIFAGPKKSTLSHEETSSTEKAFSSQSLNIKMESTYSRLTREVSDFLVVMENMQQPRSEAALENDKFDWMRSQLIGFIQDRGRLITALFIAEKKIHAFSVSLSSSLHLRKKNREISEDINHEHSKNRGKSSKSDQGISSGEASFQNEKNLRSISETKEVSPLEKENSSFHVGKADLELAITLEQNRPSELSGETDIEAFSPMESEHYIAIVEESLSQLELLLTEFIVDYEFLLSSLESAKDELGDKDTTFKDLVSEFMTSKDMNLNLQLEVEDLKSQNEFLQEEISTLTAQIDQLKDSVNYAENSESLLMSRLQDIESMYDTLKSEIEQIRFHLKIGDEGDILETLIKLQREYEDLIEENYRMQENLTDLESEIEELHAEAEELHSKSLSEASCKLTTKFSDNQEIKQQLDNLEVKLQAVTKERDFWRDIAERYKSVPVEGDELLTSTIRTDATEQKKLLQQAMEYCGRRDARKSWVFSTFSSQRQIKADHNVNDDLEREHLIDRLTEANKSYQETIMKLKSEVVGLNTSLKEESYTMRKKVDSLEQEKQAYEMKALALEQELCRMIEHEESVGPSNTM